MLELVKKQREGGGNIYCQVIQLEGLQVLKNEEVWSERVKKGLEN